MCLVQKFLRFFSIILLHIFVLQRELYYCFLVVGKTIKQEAKEQNSQEMDGIKQYS